jgi:hypothetical protein
MPLIARGGANADAAKHGVHQYDGWFPSRGPGADGRFRFSCHTLLAA